MCLRCFRHTCIIELAISFKFNLDELKLNNKKFASSVGVVTFQVLNSHSWIVANVLDNVYLRNSWGT